MTAPHTPEPLNTGCEAAPCMYVPGATTSGLTRPSSHGPRLEKRAMSRASLPSIPVSSQPSPRTALGFDVSRGANRQHILRRTRATDRPAARALVAGGKHEQELLIAGDAAARVTRQRIILLRKCVVAAEDIRAQEFVLSRAPRL